MTFKTGSNSFTLTILDLHAASLLLYLLGHKIDFQ